jgi:hypothetical protein
MRVQVELHKQNGDPRRGSALKAALPVCWTGFNRT